MIQVKETKEYVKEILKKYYEILIKKRNLRGKLLQEEQIVFNALRDPTKGDVKIVVVDDGIRHIFIENKRHPGTYFVLMNEKEAGYYTDRRPFDPYIGSDVEPEENYNLYLSSINDSKLIERSRLNDNMLQFYSIELGIAEPREVKEEEIPENINELDWKKKWEVYKKLPDYDPRKKELKEQFYGFLIRYRKYKQPEEEKLLVIDPYKIPEYVGMIARDIYPVNLRSVLRRDYKKEHKMLVDYAKEILESLGKEVQVKKNYLPDQSDYLEYLGKIEREIFRQIQMLET